MTPWIAALIALFFHAVLPALHGGAVGAFLETCAILELLRARGEDNPTQEERSAYPKTISFTVQYLRSGRPQTTYAQGKVTKLGRRVSNVFVEAWQSERDRPIATAQGQFLKP